MKKSKSISLDKSQDLIKSPSVNKVQKQKIDKKENQTGKKDSQGIIKQIQKNKKENENTKSENQFNKSEKQNSKKENQNNQKRSSSSIKRQQLSIITQQVKKYDGSQYFSQSINFTNQNQKNENKKYLQNNQNDEDKRVPSFERSSKKLSQKRYNVSLASLHQAKNSVSGSEIQRSNISTTNKGMSKSTSKINGKQTERKEKAKVQNVDPQEDQWLQQNIKKITNKSIQQINEEFVKQIEGPLKFQRQMAKAQGKIQRCLNHNTSLSLYCCIDRQLLCVGCIYSQKIHKNHRVVPMIKSLKQMNEDIDSFKNRIDSTMQQSQSLIRQSNLNLIKIQKQYPSLIHQIQTYYYQIHQLIEQKKKEQLDYIQSLRMELKTQLKVISSLLNKVNTIFIDQLRQLNYDTDKMKIKSFKYNQKSPKNISKNTTLEDTIDLTEQINNTVRRRCTYQILARYHKILNKHGDQILDQKKGFQIKLDNFRQVLDLIKYKLTMVIPIIKKEDQNSSKKKGFTNIILTQDPLKKGVQYANKAQQKTKEENKLKDQKAAKQKAAIDKANEEKSQNKKGFSTSPQVPKGLSRRILQVSNPKYSPRRNSKQVNF